MTVSVAASPASLSCGGGDGGDVGRRAATALCEAAERRSPLRALSAASTSGPLKPGPKPSASLS